MESESKNYKEMNVKKSTVTVFKKYWEDPKVVPGPPVSQ